MKKLARKCNRGIRELLRPIYNRWFYQAVNCDSSVRNILLLHDAYKEPGTAPQDTYFLWKYVIDREYETSVAAAACTKADEVAAEYASGVADIPTQDTTSLRPLYIIHRETYAANPALFAGHEDAILLYGQTLWHKILFYTRLLDVMRHTKWMCSSWQHMNRTMLGQIKNSPYIESIFTQHGITFFKPDWVVPGRYSGFLYNRILVSGKTEVELFATRGMWAEANMIKTGLLRWDTLIADDKMSQGAGAGASTSGDGSAKSICDMASCDKIFVYFTMRRYLAKMEDMTTSTYWQWVSTALTSLSHLPQVADGTYTLAIAPHHSVADAYKQLLAEANFGGCIQVVDEADIAEVKKQAALLVTDYSSMCFDMMMAGKPVVFLHIPDEVECVFYETTATDLTDPYGGKEHIIGGVCDSVEACVAAVEKALAEAQVGAENVDRNHLCAVTDREPTQPTSCDDPAHDDFFFCRDHFRQRLLDALHQDPREDVLCIHGAHRVGADSGTRSKATITPKSENTQHRDSAYVIRLERASTLVTTGLALPRFKKDEDGREYLPTGRKIKKGGKATIGFFAEGFTQDIPCQLLLKAEAKTQLGIFQNHKIEILVNGQHVISAKTEEDTAMVSFTIDGRLQDEKQNKDNQSSQKRYIEIEISITNLYKDTESIDGVKRKIPWKVETLTVGTTKS